MTRTMWLASVLFAVLTVTACGSKTPLPTVVSPVPGDDLVAIAQQALVAWALKTGQELGSTSYTVIENDGANATVHASIMLRDHPEAAWLGHVADLYFNRSGGQWQLLAEPRFDWAPAFQPRTLSGHTQCVAAVAFAPDGQTLASGSYDATARLWEVAGGGEFSRLDNGGDRVGSVAP
jgi:WD40 repeat protein/predicted small lipoprotein YifL